MLSFVSGLFSKKKKHSSSSPSSPNNEEDGHKSSESRINHYSDSKIHGAHGVIPSMSIPHIDCSTVAEDEKFRKEQATINTSKFKDLIVAGQAFCISDGSYDSTLNNNKSMAVVFSFGETNGIRGLGDFSGTSNGDSSAYIRSPFKISSIAMGYTSTVVLTEDGFALTCGSNSNGQLGMDKSESDVKQFRYIPSLIGKFIVQASCGYYFSLFLTKEGDVYGCGDNSHGQLGDDISYNSTTLVHHIKIPVKIRSIHAGYYHSIFVGFDGKAYGCGQGLGRVVKVIDGLTDVKIISASCGYDYSFLISEEGDVYGCGELGHLIYGESNGKHPVKKVEGFNHKVLTAHSGYYHTMFTTDEGVVYSCGRNQYNCLNRKCETGARDCYLFEHKTMKNIVQVSCGGYHSAALDSEGRALLFGHSGFNQSTREESAQPGILKTIVSSKEMIALPESMKITVDGKSQLKAVCIACGGWNTMVNCSPYIPFVTSKNEKEMFTKLKSYLSESRDNHQLFDIDIVITNPTH